MHSYVGKVRLFSYGLDAPGILWYSLNATVSRPSSVVCKNAEKNRIGFERGNSQEEGWPSGLWRLS